MATDGTSVSILFERASAAAAANDQADAAVQARGDPTAAPLPDKDWVRPPRKTVLAPQQRVVGIDPGVKAVFTAVVQSAAAEQTLPDPHPVRYT